MLMRDGPICTMVGAGVDMVQGTVTTQRDFVRESSRITKKITSIIKKITPLEPRAPTEPMTTRSTQNLWGRDIETCPYVPPQIKEKYAAPSFILE
jgi:hypothetical protein